MHADEATGAKIVAERLERDNYQFDPTHYHGPLLSAVAAPVSRWAGEERWQTLRPETLRRVVAVCGLLTVLVLLGCGVGTGFAAAFWSAAFVATSPLLVYYSRMFIHEPLYLLCAALALVGLVLLTQMSAVASWFGACLFGVGMGLMAATRETVVIALFSWAVAALLLHWRTLLGFVRDFLPADVSGEKMNENNSAKSHVSRLRIWQLLVAFVSAFLVVVVAYRSESAGWFGFLAFFQSFFVYETMPGHDKPFWWFFELMIFPRFSAGRWWTEGGLFFLALIPFLRWRDPSSLRQWGRFFALSGLLIFLVHSMIAYKTPWLICLGWMQFSLAAGCGVTLIWDRWRVLWRVPLLAILVGLLGWHGLQAHRAAFRFASDTRNPYAYVPTSSDLVRLAPFLNELQGLFAEPSPLIVVGEQYWPLPWYLRENGIVGYWTEWTQRADNAPVVIVLPSQWENALAYLETTHTFIPRGLRTDGLLWVAIENQLWERYLELD
jgi:uncharacterized protein (TIGR03663 family)